MKRIFSVSQKTTALVRKLTFLLHKLPGVKNRVVLFHPWPKSSWFSGSLNKKKPWVSIACLIITVLGFYQLYTTVFAEQSGSSPESGSSSRIKTGYDALVAKGTNYGVTDAADWSNDWGTWWNRIMEAAFWEPDGSATAADVFTALTFYSGSNNRTQATGSLTLACAISTFDGSANLISNALDGTGDGTNRWCMTSSGDAVAGDILSGKVVWIDGLAVTGSVTDREGDSASSAQAASGGVNYFTALAGFYDGDDRVSATDAQTAALDGDITAGNILSGVSIFGVPGSASVIDFSTLALQDYDDQNCANNNEETATACAAGDSEYTGEESTWTLTATGGTAQAVTDNAVTRTLTSNKVYKDVRTSLYWTDKATATVDNEFSYVDGDNRTTPTGNSCNFNSTGTANAFCDNQDPLSGYTEDNDVSANDFCLNLQVDGDNADADSDGATGMESDWRLPTQKDLMQAYINGSANNLPNVFNNFWSSTEHDGSQSDAFFVGLGRGTTDAIAKSSTSSVRCVRQG